MSVNICILSVISISLIEAFTTNKENPLLRAQLVERRAKGWTA
jgi:hypothetical protein